MGDNRDSVFNKTFKRDMQGTSLLKFNPGYEPAQKLRKRIKEVDRLKEKGNTAFELGKPQEALHSRTPDNTGRGQIPKTGLMSGQKINSHAYRPRIWTFRFKRVFFQPNFCQSCPLVQVIRTHLALSVRGLGSTSTLKSLTPPWPISSLQYSKRRRGEVW